MTVVYKLAGKDRYDDFLLERVLGLPFVVTPSVFNPKVPRTGEFFASTLDLTLVGREAEVLDMGTGSGRLRGFLPPARAPRGGGGHQRCCCSLRRHQRGA